jgi:hydrogenase/urease accessory protein HupE
MYRTALIPLLLCAQDVLAHPNHPGGSPLGAGLLHLLTEPDHLAVILLPLVVVAALVTLLRRRARRAGRKATARRARRV